MKRKMNVIELNVSGLRRNEKAQTSYSLPLEENLTIDNLGIKINDLCRSIRNRKNVVCVWFDPPFNISFSNGNYINEATIVVYYTKWKDLSVSLN